MKQQNEMKIEVKSLGVCSSVILLLSSFAEHGCQEDVTRVRIQKNHSNVSGVCLREEMC